VEEYKAAEKPCEDPDQKRKAQLRAWHRDADKARQTKRDSSHTSSKRLKSRLGVGPLKDACGTVIQKDKEVGAAELLL
jgi:hypothetical protein